MNRSSWGHASTCDLVGTGVPLLATPKLYIRDNNAPRPRTYLLGLGLLVGCLWLGWTLSPQTYYIGA